MVSNFRCVLELALRETTDTELVTWNQGKAAWFRVPIPGERSRIVRVAPDAYFVLRQGDHVRHFFLETDRSTEEHRRLVQKFVSYWWHLQDPRFVDSAGGRPHVNVVFVTTGERRLQTMTASLDRMAKPNRATHGGKRIFTFACEADFNAASPSSLLNALHVHSPRRSRAMDSQITQNIGVITLAPPTYSGADQELDICPGRS